MVRGKERGIEKGKKGAEREISSKELARLIVEAGKSRIHRESQQAGDARVPLGNRRTVCSLALSSLSGCSGDWRPEKWGVFRISSRAQEDLVPAMEALPD